MAAVALTQIGMARVLQLVATGAQKLQAARAHTWLGYRRSLKVTKCAKVPECGLFLICGGFAGPFRLI
jgi:hypothetical protein